MFWGIYAEAMGSGLAIAQEEQKRFEKSISGLSEEQKILARLEERRHQETLEAMKANRAQSSGAGYAGAGLIGLALGLGF